LGHGNSVHKALIIVGIVVLGVGTFLSYPTAKLIMCGDRIMQQFPPGYLNMTMSNKNYLLLIILAVIGGCLGYIVGYIVRKLGWQRIRKG